MDHHNRLSPSNQEMSTREKRDFFGQGGQGGCSGRAVAVSAPPCPGFTRNASTGNRRISASIAAARVYASTSDRGRCARTARAVRSARTGNRSLGASIAAARKYARTKNGGGIAASVMAVRSASTTKYVARVQHVTRWDTWPTDCALLREALSNAVETSRTARLSTASAWKRFKSSKTFYNSKWTTTTTYRLRTR